LRVFFFGVGYCAEALIRRAPSIEASGTARTAERIAALRDEGVDAHLFNGNQVGPSLEPGLTRAEAIVVSIPPQAEEEGPLERLGPVIAAAPALSRIVYYSTIGVYGDHRGAWVDETSPTLTRSDRGLARLRAEARWIGAGRAREVPVDILRLPGIYGPGRNALTRLREGDARRIIKPGHVSNRAHVDDIAEVTRLVLTTGLEGQIWNVADDEPAPPQDVIAFAASLLGVAAPPEEPFDEATMSPMAASFFADEKRVSAAKAKALLGFRPAYPTFREGLEALAKAGEGINARPPAPGRPA
jgi:dTDP-4-dehydrorhamnose reductase